MGHSAPLLSMQRRLLTSERHMLRNSILATVIGGLILSFILWLIGLLPAILDRLWAIFRKFGGFIAGEASIPTWLLGLLVILAFSGAMVFLKRIFPTRKMELQKESSISLKQKVELSELERKVLLVLARADGDAIYLDSISRSVGENRLRTTKALESLFDKKLISDRHNAIYGTSFVLSRSGRDLVIDLGIA
jgi:hypothetical protein